MNPRQAPAEALIRAWLELSSVVWNKRLVTGMTFNEAFVCGLLAQREEDEAACPLNATELCKATGLLRSQMNQLMGDLTEKGYVRRERSELDRRRIHIRLTERGWEAYHREHVRITEMVAELVDRMGEERTQETAQMIREISFYLREILDGTGNPGQQS